MPSPRRFPPPWIVEDHLACFIVKDRIGQALAHIYYEDTVPKADICAFNC